MFIHIVNNRSDLKMKKFAFITQVNSAIMVAYYHEYLSNIIYTCKLLEFVMSAF